jgi:exosortase
MSRQSLTGRDGLLLGIFLFTWGWLLLQTHYYWGSESYYNFGWFVPLLAAYLLYRRLPEGKPAVAKGQGRKLSPSRVGLFAGTLVLAALAVAFFRLFNEANPFWRVPLWAHALTLLGFSVAGMILLYGWATARRFTLPILFLFLALPWPWRFEQWVIHSLTGWISDLTVFALNMAGHPALRMGNTIRIEDIHLGVADACSGIRSLQALVMVGLFIGEYYFFGWFRRLVLLGGSILLVMGFSGVRAFVLALVSLGDSTDAFQFWHDLLGYVNFIGCALILFLIGEGLNRLHRSPKVINKEVPVEPLERKWTLILTSLVIGTFSLVELGVEGYYRYQESRNPLLAGMELDWERARGVSPDYFDVPENIASVLQFDFGQRIQLDWGEGISATATHYGYTGEDRMASVSSFGHSPEICVTAIGGKLVGSKDPVIVDINGISWPLKHYEFLFESPAGDSLAMQVFWLVWEPQQMGIRAEELESMTWRNQWKLVTHGRRNFARQVFLIHFFSDAPDEVLRARVKRLLDEVIT